MVESAIFTQEFKQEMLLNELKTKKEELEKKKRDLLHEMESINDNLKMIDELLHQIF